MRIFHTEPHTVVLADVLEKQTQTLGRLVKQLLDVSRFEAGANKIDPRAVELRGFLNNLEESFQVLADQLGGAGEGGSGFRRRRRGA